METNSLNEVFVEPMKIGIIFFFIATIITILLAGISGFLENYPFWKEVVDKLSNAFSFVAAISLTGATFAILGYYRRLGKKKKIIIRNE